MVHLLKEDEVKDEQVVHISRLTWFLVLVTLLRSTNPCLVIPTWTLMIPVNQPNNMSSSLNDDRTNDHDTSLAIPSPYHLIMVIFLGNAAAQDDRSNNSRVHGNELALIDPSVSMDNYSKGRLLSNNNSNSSINNQQSQLQDIYWTSNQVNSNNNSITQISNPIGDNFSQSNQHQNNININNLIKSEFLKENSKSKSFIRRINQLKEYERSSEHEYKPNKNSNRIITELMLSPIPPNTSV
ncbi:hypothetical protein ACTFIZ_007513 [Dictyostelium cf. discoideum]